jgi:hypothetical protein
MTRSARSPSFWCCWSLDRAQLALPLLAPPSSTTTAARAEPGVIRILPRQRPEPPPGAIPLTLCIARPRPSRHRRPPPSPHTRLGRLLQLTALNSLEQQANRRSLTHQQHTHQQHTGSLTRNILVFGAAYQHLNLHFYSPRTIFNTMITEV